jgi:large subunit ribosomal protein L6
MSRIGKLPVDLPEKVEVTIDSDNCVIVKGPLGELNEKIDPRITVAVIDNQVIVTRPNDSKTNRSLHGLYRALINNMVLGVSKGFEKKLQIVGVGYRATKKGSDLELQLGFSHPVVMQDPDGITTEVPQQTEIIVKGIDKQQVGNYAAMIRDWRKPEPYKGKGVRYVGEYVRRKEGKAGK